MKLKTYWQRDERFKKASLSVENYIAAKRSMGIVQGSLAPKSVSLKYLTIGDLGELKVPIYQRWLQASRLKNIAELMYLYGYDHSNPIVATLPGGTACDGNHRITAGLNILPPDEKIPVITLEFDSLAAEAAYFKAMQHPVGGAPLVEDRVKSSYHSKEPYGRVLYHLALIDPLSLFATKVALRKEISKSDVPDILFKAFTTKKCPIKVGAFIRIFHWIGLEYTRTWDKQSEPFLNALASATDYDLIRYRMNRFAEWLFSWAGPNIEIGKELFLQPVLIGFMDFYLTILNQPAITEKRIETLLKLSSKHFKKWAWYSTKLMTCKPEEAVDIVLAAFNGNRTTNRLISIKDLREMFGVRDIDDL